MLVVAENLSVELGKIAILRNISFTMPLGGTLGIVGESGSGKSMMALALMGLLPEGATLTGTLRFNGQDLRRLDEAALCQLRGAAMAMVFQEPMTALNPLHRIGAQVGEPLRLHRGCSAKQAQAAALALLARVGLADPARQAASFPHELSGGQRQRAMIAMALACGPQLLIADEPTTALDATTQAQILDLIADLVTQTGMGLLLISHDLAVIAQNVTDVLVFYAGEIVESGPVATVLAHPAHPYTRGLLAARPSLAATAGVRLAMIPGGAPQPGRLPIGCSFSPRCSFAAALCTVARPDLALAAPAHHVRCIRKEAWGRAQ